jgi:spermidine/putrescine-binding protein
MDPALLAAAKAEGQVTIYSSTNEQEGLPLWKIFEEATGIKVNYVRAADAQLMGRMAIEARTGQQSWDMINTPTANQLPESMMLPFDPPEARNVMPSARDPKRQWYGVYANYNSPAYNTNLVKPADLPKTYEEFLTKKEWVGRVAIEGTDNEWMNAIFAHYGQQKGRKLLEDLASTLKITVLDGHLAAARAVALLRAQKHRAPRTPHAMATRGAARSRAEGLRMERLLRVATCLAECGYGVQVGQLAATARAFYGDAQVWAAQAQHSGPRGRTHLMHAAYVGSANRVRFLLDRGAAADATEVHGATALMGASWHNQLDTVRLLVESRADLNRRDRFE